MSFTLVAEFRHADDAKSASEKLGRMFEKMRVNVHQFEPFSIYFSEIDMSFNFKDTPAWMVRFTPKMIQLQQILIVDDMSKSYSFTPIDIILKQLNAKAVVDIDHTIRKWDFEFDIENDQKADAFELFILDLMTMSERDYNQKYLTLPHAVFGINWGDFDASNTFERPTDKHFRLSQITFGDDGEAMWMPQFIEWLQTQGAINLHYTLAVKGIDNS